MKDIVKKSFLLGLGAASTTKKQAEKIVKELIKRNAVTIKEGRDLLKRASKAAQQEREKISEFANEEAKRIAKGFVSIPKAQIGKVKTMLKSVEKELSNEGKKVLRSVLKQLSK